MKRIYVERKQVAALISATFPDYKGSKCCVVATESVTITDLNWSGGSRSQYRGVSLNGQSTGGLDAWNAVAPWRNAAEGSKVSIPQGACIVRHGIFCGKDMGLTFYINPANMPALLPASVELSATEKLVLKYTKERKASYGGRDRYQQALDDASFRDTGDFPKREQWEAAKQALIGRGLLNTRGAITNEGRNAIA